LVCCVRLLNQRGSLHFHCFFGKEIFQGLINVSLSTNYSFRLLITHNWLFSINRCLRLFLFVTFRCPFERKFPVRLSFLFLFSSWHIWLLLITKPIVICCVKIFFICHLLLSGWKLEIDQQRWVQMFFLKLFNAGCGLIVI